DNFTMAGLGRFMIGLGAAFAYIGTLKLAALWLPANRFATVAGLATAVGMASGALSQKYLTKLVEMMGYQEALQTAVIAGIALSFIMFLLIKNRPTNQDSRFMELSPMTLKQVMSALRIIF